MRASRKGRKKRLQQQVEHGDEAGDDNHVGDMRTLSGI
jgi:hypothetical protein